MAVEWPPLATAFVDDHKQLTRALKQLKDALGRHDLSEAKRIAEELDRAAGPHILFEEEFLYPEVARRAAAITLTGCTRNTGPAAICSPESWS